MEFEWQQIFPDLQDTSQYSDWSPQCCNLDGIDSFSDFQVFQTPFQDIWNHFKGTTNNWHFHQPHRLLFYFSGKAQVFIYLFAFFYFPSVVCWNGNIHLTTRSMVSWPGSGDPSRSQNPRDFLHVSFSMVDSGLCIYHFVVCSRFHFLYDS